MSDIHLETQEEINARMDYEDAHQEPHYQVTWYVGHNKSGRYKAKDQADAHRYARVKRKTFPNGYIHVWYVVEDKE